MLNDTSKFAFNTKPIPKNESEDEAERKCSDIKGAKEHCPTRWAAVQAWMDEIRKVGFDGSKKLIARRAWGYEAKENQKHVLINIIRRKKSDIKMKLIEFP